ncbi:MAG: hypothetical protein LUG16_06000 [Candidatus Gastranaerophilales bacterium]|nr:hypothetical protein [Candidatus Gastranaerophilales bacterium]
MSIAPVNCTPIKPQASFGQKADYDETYVALKKVDEINDKYVNSKDVKSPFQIGLSCAAALAGIYAAGKAGASLVTKVVPKLPVMIENTLKSGSGLVKKASESLQKEVPGKLGKLKNASGKVLEKSENAARNLYKKVAYSKIAEDVVNPERAQKAFANVVGAAAVATTVPQILTKDADGDGIKDIAQKSQNVYTGVKNNLTSTSDTISALGEIASALS